MVYYSFDKKIKFPDDAGPEKIPNISCWNLIQLVFTEVCQLFSIFLMYYKLFLVDANDHKIRYYASIVISLLSGLIVFIFYIRIDATNVNQHNKIRPITLLILLILKYVVSLFFPSRIFGSGWVGSVLTELMTSIFFVLQAPVFLKQTVVMVCAFRCKFAAKNEDRIRIYHQMVDAEADAGLLGILVCYLRGAPQLILQLAVIFFRRADFRHISWLEQISLIAALGIVLPWAATSYNNSLRNQKNDHFPCRTVIVVFIWNAFLLTARIFSISVILALWPVHTAIAIFVHWVVATFWLYYNLEPLDFYNKNKICHFMFCAVFGIVYIFNSVNMTKERKFWHYTFFYTTVFIQNTVSLVLWCANEPTETAIYTSGFVVINLVLFICGIFIMIIYYTKLHPRNETNRLDKNDTFVKEIP